MSTDSETMRPAVSAGDALFLDVDGTLLDIAPSPHEVMVDPALPGLLQAAAAKLGGALALISGRMVADVDALFAPARLCVGGQHGAERRDSTGVLHCAARPSAELARAAERLGRMAAAHRGLAFEDKGYSVAVHFRAAPHLEELVRREVRALAAELGGGFEVQPGKKVLELKPVGWNKGTAIAQFMGEAPFAGRRAVFVGDDLTDEHGFGAVNRMGGCSIKVGPEPSLARARLPDPQAVRAWLERLAR